MTFKICSLLLAWSAIILSNTGSNAALTGCVKKADCGLNQYCRMYDYTPDYPPIWPPCPHFGLCGCIDRTIMLGNGSCVPVVTLNLGDNCTNSIFERYVSPERMHCGDNKQVVCNWPFLPDGQQCVSTTTAALTSTTVSWMTTALATTGRPAFSDETNFTFASYLAACNPVKRLVCDQSQQGLCCLLRGPDVSYMQCQCCDPHFIFDATLGKCRPRVYGDLCVNDEDCNSGQISSTGFECRLGRCRCSAGYNPVDNLYWNESSKTTYLRRICIIAGSLTSVPTGHVCTMNPEDWSQYNSTRICHKRAFCHQCFRERISYSLSHTQSMGVCREIACSKDSDCGVSMRCNKWGAMIDPPCERGICDCESSKSFYMDRYSRCSQYRALGLGDRCLLKNPNGLYLWYQTNEDWDDKKDCLDDTKSASQGAYTGILKCSAPTYEDVDGNCVANNDTTGGVLYSVRSYGEPCDTNDFRLPKVICDPDKKLECHNKKCACTNNVSSMPNYVYWDGSTCRLRTFGDPCKTDADCLTGIYYAPAVVGAKCDGGFCSCADGFSATDVTHVDFDNGAYTQTITKNKYCFPGNITIVSKGGDCHLNPIRWAGEALRLSLIPQEPALVCNPEQNLFCIRCAADFDPDDESRGICRSYSRLSFDAPMELAATCAPVAATGSVPLAPNPVIPNTNPTELVPNPEKQLQKCDALQVKQFKSGLMYHLLLISYLYLNL